MVMLRRRRPHSGPTGHAHSANGHAALGRLRPVRWAPAGEAMERLGALGGGGGGGPSRRELAEAVEGQRRQLGEYQARLRDVVGAYKSLLKEKEALEAGLRALHAAQRLAGPHGAPPAAAAAAGQDAASVHSQDGGGGGSTSPGSLPCSGASAEGDEEEEAEGRRAREEAGSSGDSSGEAERRALQLKAQLATVSSALATVTQEKSRMEASYQADRRQARLEREELCRRAEREQGGLQSELRAAQEQLAETKGRLLAQQHDRAQEQSDHAVMLRELQRLLHSERAQRHEAERALQEASEALAGTAGVAGRAEDSERQAKQLAREVEDLRRALQAAREESGRPDPQLHQLQAEVAALRSHFQAQLLQEMRKVLLVSWGEGERVPDPPPPAAWAPLPASVWLFCSCRT